MSKVETVELRALDVRYVDVKIKGLSPVILHKWSEKAKRDMLDKQMKKTVKKVAKDPEEQYRDSIYRHDDGDIGFPADGLKKAMVRGAKQLGLVMTDMNTGFSVHGEYSKQEDRELIRIYGDLSMREDTVTLSKGVADLRYRGQLANWSGTITLSYNAAVVSFDHIVNMLSAAGYGVGIGDWRVEKRGMFGRFKVLTSEET